ncbi:iron complex transport system permease protein [Methanofollis sp. W23]|uniref:FecCD family ABC transporter permease n=1 Tax=Methanofollis sp. W23 TaxID=2817849 RepID=UPI001AE2C030|nr:iron ABC transporter permease [Methanofollis sp. W23]MBP2146425.1 iron complex transport system permease protein [Methanofollis sp. W23]
MNAIRSARNWTTIGFLAGLPLVLFLVSFFLGRYAIDPITAVQIIVAAIIDAIPGFPLSIPHTWPAVMDTVVLKIRLPRICAAMLVGAGLAISGAAFQGLFRNPLVSPHILGVASGAGFGAALGILISGSMFVVQSLAFTFGIIAVVVTYLLARVYRTTPTLVLVLAGIIVSAFFQAMISLTKYVADPYEKLPAIVFWMMGSLADVRVGDLYIIAPLIIVCIVILLLIRWRINILSVGDEEAKALGINTTRMAQIIIVCATVITSMAVCISGIIGWVGLVVPHIARMIVGPDYKKILPVSVVIGACYLLVVDDIARTLTAAEIPLGILTAVIGAPVFAYLLKFRKVGWE